MDQMIGSFSGPNILDEPVRQRPPPDRFGAGARDNFPSAFSDDNAAAARHGGGGNDMSNANLERAIAASME